MYQFSDRQNNQTQRTQRYTSQLDLRGLAARMRKISTQNDQIYVNTFMQKEQKEPSLKEIKTIEKSVNSLKEDLKHVYEKCLSHKKIQSFETGSKEYSIEISRSIRRKSERKNKYLSSFKVNTSEKISIPSLNNNKIQTSTNILDWDCQIFQDNKFLYFNVNHNRTQSQKEINHKQILLKNNLWVYIPLNKIFSSSYLRQISPKQLQVLLRDKMNGFCQKQNYYFANSVILDPNQLVSSVFNSMDQQRHKNLIIYCMDGTQKKSILYNFLSQILKDIDEIMEFKYEYHDLVFLENQIGIEKDLRILYAVNKRKQQYHQQQTNLQRLFYDIEVKEDNYKQLKNLIIKMIGQISAINKRLWYDQIKIKSIS